MQTSVVMAGDYFSDRERGPRARTDQQILRPAWGGIVALVNGAITNGGFGVAFPSECPDGHGITGTNFHAMGLAVKGEISEIAWPLDADNTPDTLAVLDLVEFCFIRIARPESYDFHGFFGHDHLNFDKDAGRADFRGSANRIFARNKLAYELDGDGRIVRLAALCISGGAKRCPPYPSGRSHALPSGAGAASLNSAM